MLTVTLTLTIDLLQGRQRDKRKDVCDKTVLAIESYICLLAGNGTGTGTRRLLRMISMSIAGGGGGLVRDARE